MNEVENIDRMVSSNLITGPFLNKKIFILKEHPLCLMFPPELKASSNVNLSAFSYELCYM